MVGPELYPKQNNFNYARKLIGHLYKKTQEKTKCKNFKVCFLFISFVCYLPYSFSLCYDNIFQCVRHSGVRPFSHLIICLETFLSFHCKMLHMRDNQRAPPCLCKCTPLSEPCSYVFLLALQGYKTKFQHAAMWQG